MADKMPGLDESHVQVKLFTKIKKYETQDTPFSIPTTSACNELNDLLKSLLFSDNEEEQSVNFDFLIEGELLRSSLSEYVSQKNKSTESVFEIEYILKQEKPKLSHSLLHDDWVSSVDISGDIILTGSYDNTISIWNTEGKCVSAIEGHTMAVKKVLWNTLNKESGSFISASQDQSVLIWQFNPKDSTSSCVHICKGHSSSVDCLSIQPSGLKFASGSWDKMIKIWEADVNPNAGDEEESESKKVCKEGKTSPKNIRTPLTTLSGHKEPVSALIWNEENELISAGWDHCIRLWDTEISTNKHTLTGNKAILSIAYSKEKNLVVSGTADKFIRVWDIRASGAVVKNMLSSHNGWVSSVDWSPNNENLLVSGSYDNTVKLWDIRSTAEPIDNLEKHNDKVMCVSWKQSQYILSGGADCNMHVNEYTFNSS